MKKIFLIAKREGRHGLDFVIESNVTGEVFLLLLENPHYEFPLFYELRRMLAHIREVRKWVKSGAIKFAGSQVVYTNSYC